MSMDSQCTSGTLKLSIYRALRLIDTHRIGKNHPYVRAYLDTQHITDAQKGKYEVNDDGMNPVFDLDFTFYLSGSERFLILEVYGHELFTKDYILGMAKIPIADLMKQVGGVRFSVPLMPVDNKGSAGSIILSALYDTSSAKLTTTPPTTTTTTITTTPINKLSDWLHTRKCLGERKDNKKIGLYERKDNKKDYQKDIKNLIKKDFGIMKKDVNKAVSRITKRTVRKDARKDWNKDMTDKSIPVDKSLESKDAFKPRHELSREVPLKSRSIAPTSTLDAAAMKDYGITADKPVEVFKPHHELRREEFIKSELPLEQRMRDLHVTDKPLISEQDKLRDRTGLDLARRDEEAMLAASQQRVNRSDINKLK